MRIKLLWRLKTNHYKTCETIAWDKLCHFKHTWHFYSRKKPDIFLKWYAWYAELDSQSNVAFRKRIHHKTVLETKHWGYYSKRSKTNHLWTERGRVSQTLLAAVPLFHCFEPGFPLYYTSLLNTDPSSIYLNYTSHSCYEQQSRVSGAKEQSKLT